MNEQWPNFFIVGAPRSGTTFLYHYLIQIPGVFMCPVKEPNYFAQSIDPKKKLIKPIRDTKKYLKLFQGVTDETAIGESSPTYLWDPKAAKLIHQTVPDAKIIMILRNPVERSFSHYLMGLGIGNETLPYTDAMTNAIASENDYSSRIAMAGFYYEQVKRYLELFPKEQLKIFIFEEFIKDTKKSVQDVLDFLEVDSPIPDNIQIVDNTFDLPVGNFSKYFIRNRILRSVVRELFPNDSARNFRKLFRKSAKKPPMTDSEREFGEKLYFEDSKKLENLLNISLPWTFLNKK